MEPNEIMGERLSVLESRVSVTEQQLHVLMQGGTGTKKRQKRELTPEQKRAIRERLVKGQEAARARREAEAKARTEKGEKGTNNGTPQAAN